MKETKGLERGRLILIHQLEDGEIRVTDYRGREEHLSSDKPFSIYFKDARFKSDGILEAVYLGTHDDGRLFDGDCTEIRYFPHKKMWLDTYGVRHKEARLVVATNQAITLVITGDIDA